MGAARSGAKSKAGTLRCPACVKNFDSRGSGLSAAVADYAERHESGAQQAETGGLGYGGCGGLKGDNYLAVAAANTAGEHLVR